MDRKKFGAVLDEAVGQLEMDVRGLKNQRQTLTLNIKDLEKTRDELSEEIVNLTVKHKETKEKTEEEIKTMLKVASEKIVKANKKESEASGKLSELNQKTKEAENLIKSNEGLQKSLAERKNSTDIKIEKLSSISNMIIESIKTI